MQSCVIGMGLTVRDTEANSKLELSQFIIQM